MENFKYFKWGYPDSDSSPVYAIYQPLLNCFLAIVDAEYAAWQLKYLLTSRYTTAVIRIDQATNYSKNIIDNSVCQQWKLENTNDIQTFTLYENEPNIVNAKSLVPAQNKSLDWNIDQEKQWAFLCLHWIYFFESLRWQYKYSDIDNFLKSVVDQQTKYYPDEFRKEVLAELYLGRDFESTDQLLLSKIQTHKELQPFWKSYLDNLQ